jgi:streptogramin lyase
VADRSAFGGSGALVAVNPLNGAQQVVSSAGAFVNPSGVAVEADGNILVVDSDAFGGTGGVIRVNPSTGAQAPLCEGGLLVNPFAAAIEADGTLVIAALNGARVARVDPRSGVQTKILPRDIFDSAVDVAIDRDGSVLVVVNVEAGGELVRLNRVSGEPTPVPGADFQNPRGVAVGPDGIIWVVEDRHGVGPSVVRFDPVSKQRTLLTSRGLLRGPFRIALEARGTMVVSDPDVSGGNGLLIRVDSTSGAQSVLAQGELLVEPFGIAIA